LRRCVRVKSEMLRFGRMAKGEAKYVGRVTKMAGSSVARETMVAARRLSERRWPNRSCPRPVRRTAAMSGR